MKKVWFMLAMMVCILASCSDGGSDSPVNPTPKPEEVKTEITIDSGIISNGLSFGVAEGEQTVSFSVNADWTLSVASTTSGATWCKASTTSGSKGSATVKFTVDENTGYDDRSVSVTIKAGTVSKTFTITQKGADALLVTTTKYEVAQEGGQIEIEVKANISYQMEIAEDAKSWITEAESKGRALTTTKHKLDIAMNEDTEKREGEITFKSGDKVETVKVYQAGGVILLLSQNEYNVSDKGDTISVDIKSNIDFGVQMPDVDWIIDEASSRGLSSHTLKYVVSANEEYDSRSAEIVFFDKNSDLKDTLKVVQAQKDAIILSEKNISVAKEGGTIEVKVNTNVDFEVQIPSDATWITQIESRSLIEYILYFEIKENENDDRRTIDILFTDKANAVCETLTITQRGNSAQLISGKEFKLAIYNLANNMQETNYEIGDQKIESIKYTQIKDNLKEEKYTIVSTEESELPIYATWDGSCIELQSKAESIDFNEDASYMFYGLGHLREINFEGLYTSEVKNMKCMFCFCYNLDLDTISFDTSNVTDMSYMFAYMRKPITLDLNTSNVENMEGMFGHLYGRINFINFNTSKVKNMHEMFIEHYCELDLSLFDTSQVTDMSDMFRWYDPGMINRTLDLSSFDTSNVINMEGMFRDVSLKTINISSFNTKNVENMSYMFANAGQQYYGRISDLSILKHLDTSNVKNMHSMFLWCLADSIDISNFDMSNVIDMSHMFQHCENIRSLNLSNYNLKNVKDMSYAFSCCSQLEEVIMKDMNTDNVTNMEYLFWMDSALKHIDISGLNTNNVTNINGMFSNCTSLNEIDLSNFDTSNVTNMGYLFEECSTLSNLDLSNFNTQNVTNMCGLFYKCSSLIGIDLSNFNTENVTNMGVMFSDCSSLSSLDLSNFKTEKVTNMYSMFKNCRKLETLNIDGFSAENIKENFCLNYFIDGLSNLSLLNLGKSFVPKYGGIISSSENFGNKKGLKIICCQDTMEYLKKGTLRLVKIPITWINAETNEKM